MSQEQIADMLGMTQSAYSRKEKGNSKISAEEWERLSKTLEVPLEDIFQHEEGQVFIFNDNPTGNYSGTNYFYSIPSHMEGLLETQRKYIEKLENEIRVLKKLKE
ncbi:transcriptional regulator with XRE-family HTH domain [Chryseobacterium rhizosphaerae]|uniref:helix-turn-helix transcriptional regulator n=1 Tax=Chryseobacterium rhizosphaerae TaxID=395937 RepID=UPI0028547AD0|nr:helix-turn-helix transcriptional regulator [Chryseobacterium rhizosphaerae]MDR6544083.1 transcriptional regulator with XRE-family HTH domain [Chryseobacterium rhizosphaerae]